MATIAVPAPEPDARVTRAARGVMLGLMAGDALGASVEGYPPDEARHACQCTHVACDHLQLLRHRQPSYLPTPTLLRCRSLGEIACRGKPELRKKI